MAESVIQPGKYIGRIIEVEFLDHVWGEEKEKEIYSCRIWGKLIDVDNKQIIVQMWESNKSPTDEPEFAHLVKSTITAIRPLVYDVLAMQEK